MPISPHILWYSGSDIYPFTGWGTYEPGFPYYFPASHRLTTKPHKQIL
jgi:hypothetical protein